MPQKRNPMSSSFLRAAPARLLGHYAAFFAVLKGLPSSYNKDLQEDKEPLRRGVEDTLRPSSLPLVLRTFARSRSAWPRPMDPSIFATDLVDALVEKGLPFRRAHGVVSEPSASRKAPAGRSTADGGRTRALHPRLATCRTASLTPGARSGKETSGSTHPASVARQLEKARAILGAPGARDSSLKAHL